MFVLVVRILAQVVERTDLGGDLVQPFFALLLAGEAFFHCVWFDGDGHLVEQHLTHELERKFHEHQIVAADLLACLGRQIVNVVEVVSGHELAKAVDIVAGHEKQLQAARGRFAHGRSGGFFLQDQLSPAATEAVVFLQPLFLTVGLDGDRPRLVVAVTVRLLHQRVGVGIGELILTAHGQQRHRVIPASGGAVLVDAAPFRFHELAGGPVLDRLQLHAGNAVHFHLVGQGVFEQEFTRGHVQSLLEPQDVVGRERDVDVRATSVPAIDAAVATEGNFLVAVDQRRLDGTGRKGDFTRIDLDIGHGEIPDNMG